MSEQNPKSNPALQNIIDHYLDSLNAIYANINEKITTYKSISVYPNPNSGRFVVDFKVKTDEHVDLKICDLIGNEIYAEKYVTGNLKLPIDLSNYSKGIYLLSLKYSSGKEDTRRISVQ